MDLLSFYLDHGANPDFLFTTGEWNPMPVWEYFLFSMNRRGREPRLDFAELLFKRLVQSSGGMNAALQKRLDDTLLALCRDNYLAQSVDRILRLGANVNAHDEKGRTPILVAVEKKGHGNNLFAGYPATHLIGVLMVHGADLSARNEAGKNALQIMKDFKHPLRELYDNGKIYYLGIRALEAGRIDATLRQEFLKLGMPLP